MSLLSDAQAAAERAAQAVPAIDLESMRDAADEIASEPGTGNWLPEERSTTTTGEEVSRQEKAIFATTSGDPKEVASRTDPGLVNFGGDIALGRLDEFVSRSPIGTGIEAAFELPEYAEDDVNLPGPTTADTYNPIEGAEGVVQEGAEEQFNVDLGEGLGDELGLLTGLIALVAGLWLIRPLLEIVAGATE